MAKTTADGKWLDAKGDALHPDLVRADERLRDELVEDLVCSAADAYEQLKALKRHTQEEIRAFLELLMDKYEINYADKSAKGNFILSNYSNTARVEVRLHERIEFDEKIQLAKVKVDAYLSELTKESGTEIKTLIAKAFEVDKQGQINTKKVLALRSIDIAAPEWKAAMELINESIRVVASRRYVRFFVRESINDEWMRIPLNITEIPEEYADEELSDAAAALDDGLGEPPAELAE